MFNILPLVIIVISLAIITVIVARKFSMLAALDVGTIQEEREAKFKEQIVSNRLKRSVLKWKARLERLVRPLGETMKRWAERLYGRLKDLKTTALTEAPLPPDASAARAAALFQEAAELVQREEFEEAEMKYIEIIGLDSKNIPAFRQLGKLYIEEKNFGEAIQTFEHVLKLQDEIADTPAEASAPEETVVSDSERAGIFLDLALARKAAGDTEEAAAALRKALRLEPNNPRYLDTMLELCIMKKDKITALDALEKLAKANPENQKLGEFKKQIDEL